MRSIVAALMLAFLVACNGSADRIENPLEPRQDDPPEETSAGSPEQRLQEALPFVPVDSRTVSYADWEETKAAHESSGLTSSSDAADVESFLDDIRSEGDAAAGVFPSHVYDSHLEVFGWDSVDLSWELSISRLGHGMTYVLAFSPRFNFDSIESRLIQCGFHRFPSKSGEILSVDPDADNCMNDQFGYVTDTSMSSVGILKAERILVLSRLPRSVEDLLEARGDPQRSLAGFGRGSLTPYERPAHLFMVAEEPCRHFSFESTSSGGRIRDREVGPYALLTYALGYGGGNLSGQISMIYARPDFAQKDLEWRTEAAKRFSSSRNAFEFAGSRVVSQMVVLDVRPVVRSLDLWPLFLHGEAPYAAC